MGDIRCSLGMVMDKKLLGAFYILDTRSSEICVWGVCAKTGRFQRGTPVIEQENVLSPGGGGLRDGAGSSMKYVSRAPSEPEAASGARAGGGRGQRAEVKGRRRSTGAFSRSDHRTWLFPLKVDEGRRPAFISAVRVCWFVIVCAYSFGEATMGPSLNCVRFGRNCCR